MKVSADQGAHAHKAGWRRTTLSAHASDHAAAAIGQGPANRLKQRIADAYPAEADKWSGRRTLGFIVLTCGGFWLAVGLGLRAIFH